MKYAYSVARASTTDQVNTIPAQLRLNKQYAMRTNLNIIQEYALYESGWKSKRELFNQLIADVKSQLKQGDTFHLIFDKVDRLTRNVDRNIIELEEWRKAGLLVMHFPNDNLTYHKESPAIDETKFDMAIMMAKAYSNQIRDNVKRTFTALRKQGRTLGWVPLGYKNAEKGLVTIDETKKDVVIRIYTLYAAGLSMRRIEQQLAYENLTSRKEKRIYTSTIESVLKHEIYKGTLHGVKHGFGTFIDATLIEACEQRLQTKQKVKIRDNTAKSFTFRGLLKCDMCNTVYSPYLAKKKYPYYRGGNTNCACYNNHVSESAILPQFTRIIEMIEFPDEVKKWGIEYLRERLIEDRKDAVKIEQRLNGEKQKLEERKTRIIDAYLDNILNGVDAEKKKREIDEKLLEISTKLQAVTIESENVINKVMSLANFLDKIAIIFESSNSEEKNQLLKLLTSNCTLNGKSVNIMLSKPYSYFIEKHSYTVWRAILLELRTFTYELA